jgi:hypothetical protein
VEAAGTSSEPQRGRRPRTGRRGASAVAVLTLTGVAVAGVWGSSPTSWTGFQESLVATVPTPAAPSSAVPSPATSAPADPKTTGSSSSAPVPAAPPADRPTPAGGSTRLATAPPVPAGGGPHAFAMVQANGVTPVAYDPCRSVH